MKWLSEITNTLYSISACVLSLSTPLLIVQDTDPPLDGFVFLQLGEFTDCICLDPLLSRMMDTHVGSRHGGVGPKGPGHGAVMWCVPIRAGVTAGSGFWYTGMSARRVLLVLAGPRENDPAFLTELHISRLALSQDGITLSHNGWGRL